MGVILNRQMEKGCRLGMWEISEDYEGLLSTLHLEESEAATLCSYRNQERKLEFLSVRALITSMLDSSARITYNGARKPFLKDRTYNISITHSNLLTSVLMSREKRVGIDLEYMSKQITQIAPRFLNEHEYITEIPELQQYHAYIHWCAKEALYKLCDEPRMKFKRNLIIDPFQVNDRGVIRARVMTDSISEDFNLNYFRLNNYVVVWCCKL